MPGLDRGLLLLQQGRHDLAEQELRRHLSEDSQSVVGHGLLSQCLVRQKKLAAAIDEAQTAVHLAPDNPYCHFVLADALYHVDRLAEAETAIREALQLDPADPGHHSLHAAILLERQQPKQALEAVKRGLEIDPEHTGCVNLHALVLRQLGRTRETEAFAASTLAREPENPFMHAAQGWNLLEHGQTRQAAEHFREALRLDPDLDYARMGLLEAMKSRFAPYRWFVLYSIWTSRLTGAQSVLFIVGLLVAVRVVRAVAAANPALSIVAVPLVALYIVFVYITWTAAPLSNVLLRLHPLGRHALTREERLASTLAGIALALALVFLVAMPIIGVGLSLLGAIVFAMAVIPISAVFALAGSKRMAMAALGAVVLLIGLGAIGMEAGLIGGADEGNPLMSYYIIGVLLFTWITVGLRAAR